MEKISVNTVCEVCDGSGIIVNPNGLPGVAFTCAKCNGAGMAVVTYTPFVKRKLVEGVTLIYIHGNDAFFYPTNPAPVTYQNFLSGFRPLPKA